ncbi:hypothetical protein [Streptomyces sp. NPDC059009]|uniref:hypothetical protein n=1 Tax=Streptomyces sp. NPDC059009 TaxID=3346694 RepID=UPI00367EEFB1
MSSHSPLRPLWTHISTTLREVADDDRGVTTEQVIWIAFLAALALTVTALFGPQIVAAARNVKFQ